MTYLEDTTFNFQIGPSAGESGYTGITGETNKYKIIATSYTDCDTCLLLLGASNFSVCAWGGGRGGRGDGVEETHRMMLNLFKSFILYLYIALFYCKCDHIHLNFLGRPGWGISWHVNGTLIPELVLKRGRTYTFIAEGGNDPTIPARYHPLYITNLIDGGRLQNTMDRQAVS